MASSQVAPADFMLTGDWAEEEAPNTIFAEEEASSWKSL